MYIHDTCAFAVGAPRHDHTLTRPSGVIATSQWPAPGDWFFDSYVAPCASNPPPLLAARSPSPLRPRSRADAVDEGGDCHDKRRLCRVQQRWRRQRRCRALHNRNGEEAKDQVPVKEAQLLVGRPRPPGAPRAPPGSGGRLGRGAEGEGRFRIRWRGRRGGWRRRGLREGHQPGPPPSG